MAGDLFHRLLIVVVVPVGRFCVLVRCVGTNRAGQHGEPAHLFAQVGVVRHLLRQNVLGTLNRCCRIWHFLFRGNKRSGLPFRLHTGILRHQCPCQRFQSPCDRHGCPCLSLGAVRQIQILHLHQRSGTLNLLRQLRCQLSLCLNGAGDLRLALFQLPQVLQPVVQFPKQLVIQRAGHLFPVPCDKRNGLAVVQQCHCVLHLLRAQVKLLRQHFQHLHDSCPPVWFSAAAPNTKP